MFLYLLNEKEGTAFLELSYQAMKINGELKDSELAEFDNYRAELDLPNYEVKNISYKDCLEHFKVSTIQVKRSIIIELCGILYASKEIDNNEMTWLKKLANDLHVEAKETDRLIRWSKDFSDFIEIGLMYINAQS